jgi:hypothetical protein
MNATAAGTVPAIRAVDEGGEATAAGTVLTKGAIGPKTQDGPLRTPAPLGPARPAADDGKRFVNRREPASLKDIPHVAEL